MTGRITVLGARQMQQSLFGRTTTPLQNYYMALCQNVEPTIFNTGEELDEIVGDPSNTGYYRKQIPNTADWFMANDANSLTNRQDIVFDAALTDWGQVKYWGLCNSAENGELYACGRLSSVLNVSALDRVVIPQGSMHISIAILFQAQ